MSPVWTQHLLSQDRHDGREGCFVSFCDEDGDPMTIMFSTEEKAEFFQATIAAIAAEREPWNVEVSLTISEYERGPDA